MQKCCGTYVPQHFLYLLTIRSLNIILNKDKKKQPQKHNPQKKVHKKDCKRRAFTVLKFYFASRFFSSF